MASCAKSRRRTRGSVEPLPTGGFRVKVYAGFDPVSKKRIYRAASLGVDVADDARIFSRDPDEQSWLLPDSVSQRYERMCRRLGWDMNVHQLRHYSAAEQVGAGVDLRTIAGRLGHSGGGVTTLRFYSAWLPEPDHRAATSVHDGDRAVGCIKRETGSSSARLATAATVRVPLAGSALPAG